MVVSNKGMKNVVRELVKVFKINLLTLSLYMYKICYKGNSESGQRTMRTSSCFYLTCSWRNALWLNAMHCGKKWWIREFVAPYIFPLNPDYVAARSLRSLRSNYYYLLFTYSLLFTVKFAYQEPSWLLAYIYPFVGKKASQNFKVGDITGCKKKTKRKKKKARKQSKLPCE